MIHQIEIKGRSRKKIKDPLPSSHSFTKLPSPFATQSSHQSSTHLKKQFMMPARAHGVTFSLLLLLSFLATAITTTESASLDLANGSAAVGPLVPLIGAEKMKTLVMNETRRKLGSFQICALCTCCGGAKGLCLPSPCCYAINCNIPNRPFGFCSFTPKTCNCFGCHI
ncbi:unnamed protein product [Malus baccata var. baccata]